MSHSRDLIEISDITEDEQIELVSLLQRHSEGEVRPDHERSVVGASLAAAFTWIISHPEDAKKALALAEKLIVWLGKWRKRRAVAALPQTPAAPERTDTHPGRIIITLVGQAPKDITSATDGQIRDYFRRHPEAN